MAEVKQSNSFAALDDSEFGKSQEPQEIDTSTIKVTSASKPKRERRPGKVFKVGEFKNVEQPQTVNFSRMLKSTDHYLQLAREAINCLCDQAVRTIQYKLDHSVAGTTSMNVLGPVFKDEFYVRLSPTQWAFVKESTLRNGKADIDGVEYVLHPYDAIRIWDVICGPNDHPTLLKDHKIESLGEKLQRVVQKMIHDDLIKDGELTPEQPYNPTVWMFLAYSRHFRNRQEPCRFINMCSLRSGETAPSNLMSVSEYFKRAERKPRQQSQQGQQPRQQGQRRLERPSKTGKIPNSA